MSTDMIQPDEVVIVIDRYKIRQSAFIVIGKNNVVINVESHYTARRGHSSLLKSAELRAVPGCTFFVPWADNISGLVVNVYAIQDKLTCFIGQAEINCEYFGIHPTNLDLYIKNCGQIVGKVALSVHVRQIFHDPSSCKEDTKVLLNLPSAAVDAEATRYCIPTPDGFRFNRLSRPINWERLRSINLRRVTQNADVNSLLSAMDDVLSGNVDDEEVDPRLGHALKVAQLSAQYIVAGNQLLKSKHATIQKGIAAFDEEEDRLDLELSKLRAKCRARQREFDDLDGLELKYNKLLRYCDPKLAQTHRKEEKRRLFKEQYEQEKNDRQFPIPKESDGNQNLTDIRESSSHSSDRSLGAEDSLDSVRRQCQSAHPKVHPTTLSDNEPHPHQGPVNDSVEHSSTVLPKLLRLKPPCKEESFRQFRVIKKPDESYEAPVLRTHARAVFDTKPADTSALVGTHSVMAAAPLEMAMASQMPLAATLGSTNMSVDSLLQTADTRNADELTVCSPRNDTDKIALNFVDMVDEDCHRSLEPAVANTGAITEDLVFEEVVEGVDDDMEEHKANIVVLRANHVHMEPDRDAIAKEVLHDTASNPRFSIYTSSVGDGMISVNSSSAGAERKIGPKNREVTVVQPGLINRAISPIQKMSEVGREGSNLHSNLKLRSSGDRWARSNRFKEELLEHNDLFEPAASFEHYDNLPNTSLSDASMQIPHESIANAFPLVGHQPTGSRMSPDDDIVSPLGVVGTSILRKRGASGTNDSTVSDEDDRVLIGTTTLHPLDYTGLISVGTNDTNEQSAISESHLDIYEDHELSSTAVTVPLQEPPIPPSFLPDVVPMSTRRNFSSPLLSAADTERSSTCLYPAVDNVGVGDRSDTLNSNGEDSSEINISQGFIENLAARYLNPDHAGEVVAVSGVMSTSDPRNGNGEEELDVGGDDEANDNVVRWLPGRASLDLIETAMAIDAYISSIRVDSAYLENALINKLHLRFNFLEATSNASPTIAMSLRSSGSNTSMNFGAHIEFDRKSYKLLSDEIENEGDELSLQVIVFGEVRRSNDVDDIEDKVIGIASVNMWFMIEDSCAIVLQVLIFF